ncbi:hypothetical protein Gotri_028009, partial [Gossypium trilobum]|nr:hypothetical protein [Gossypium trilobum]
PGAKFIHAAVDLSVSDIVSPTYVPLVVQSFFDHDRAINYDGHTRPLLSIQVTELVDGVFIGCSMNHAIADGTTFWHFINTFSEIFQAQGDTKIKISRSPMLERWFPEGNNGPLLTLPFTHQNEFITRFETPHSLSAFVWRSITRARRLPCEIVTCCMLAINNRSRLEPPLSPNYFGNSFQTVTAMTTAGELLDHGLGWAAWKLYQAVVNHSDKSVRGYVNDWLRSPFVYQCSPHLYPRIHFTLRSGYGNKFDGKVSPYPGREGKGSVDIEICLPSFSMNSLESDEAFMAAAS